VGKIFAILIFFAIFHDWPTVSSSVHYPGSIIPLLPHYCQQNEEREICPAIGAAPLIHTKLAPNPSASGHRHRQIRPRQATATAKSVHVRPPPLPQPVALVRGCLHPPRPPPRCILHANRWPRAPGEVPVLSAPIAMFHWSGFRASSQGLGASGLGCARTTSR
jgi:hypothetical protein